MLITPFRFAYLLLFVFILIKNIIKINKFIGGIFIIYNLEHFFIYQNFFNRSKVTIIKLIIFFIKIPPLPEPRPARPGGRGRARPRGPAPVCVWVAPACLLALLLPLLSQELALGSPVCGGFE